MLLLVITYRRIILYIEKKTEVKRKNLGMTEELKEALKEMQNEAYEWGKIDAAQAALFSVLSTKGKITEDIKQEIRRQKNYRGLMRWLESAVDIPNVSVFEERIMF